MFERKKCKNCKEKIKDSYDFCPNCGAKLSTKKSEWGMLGKNDLIEENQETQNIFPEMNGISGGILEKMLGNAMKMLEKELSKEMNQNIPKKTNLQIVINGKKVNPEQMFQNKKTTEKKQEKTKKQFLPGKQEEFKLLKKQEPKTNIRRMSNKVIYELELTGVKSADDISILQLESSIEIRAIATKKAYFKVIQINLPLVNYTFSKGKLSLELQVD